MHGTHFIQDLAVILIVAGCVGWLCRKIGLSVVVGYLVAGMVVGPYTPPFSLVEDVGAVETLAQLGVIFLMFSIGLKLSLRKLRRLGFSLLGAVFCGAAIVYALTRVGGALAGLSTMEGVFLAAMFVASSSAIVSKVLQEVGDTHERSGQLAIGVTVLEDVVAVVALTLLNSMIHAGRGGGTDLWETLGLFGAFVVVAGICGLLILPGLLRRLSISAGEEVQTIGVAGILFGLAVAAQSAGYSLALGAFLLGTIVAETPHRIQVDRSFEGMRDIFTAVFFVAIGMQIDVHMLGDLWLQVLLVSVLAIACRIFAVTTGLSVIGNSVKDSLRAAIAVIPIGEFSFIIAQLGVSAKVIPQRYYVLAVGVSLVTTLTSPFLTKRSEAIAAAIMRLRPSWLADWHGSYFVWLERLKSRRRANRLWQLSRKRFIQIGVEALFITGMMVFSDPMRRYVEKVLGKDWLFQDGPSSLFWAALIVVLLAPFIALWRNISALSLMYAQVSVADHPNGAKIAPRVEWVFKAAAGAAIFLWILTLLPVGPDAGWLLLMTGLIAAAGVYFLRRKLIYWHSELEIELHGMLEGPRQQSLETAAPWVNPRREWNFELSDCVLPDLAACQGKSLAELKLRSDYGLTIVGIERQGCLIALPAPQTLLFPRDKLLIIGPPGQMKLGKQFLGVVSGELPVSEFEDLRMEPVFVAPGNRAAGKDLRALAPAQKHHVLIAGLRRGVERILNPTGNERIEVGDELLVLGTPDQIVGFKEWLEEGNGTGAGP